MIALINGRATDWHARLPLSVMAIGASLEGRYPYAIFDGNVDAKLESALFEAVITRGIRYAAFTVMPGRQLTESILLTQALRSRFPHITVVWGGYFPTLHTEVVLASGLVNYVIRNQGDRAFVQLIEALEAGESCSSIRGLSYVDGTIRHNTSEEILDPGTFSPLPYHAVDVRRYIEKTVVGTRTINYHSSVGCPFPCGFCAVAASYGARWRGIAAGRISDDLRSLQRHYGINAVEFHDNNFFTSESRVLEFARLMDGAGITWWGEGRPDTLLAYDSETWEAMKAGGCVMIFLGAESGSAGTLALMHKGGTQTPDTVLALAERMGRYGIIPEFSFVLGSPSDRIDDAIDHDLSFIRTVKRVNPDAEIILYVYSPVFFDEAEIFRSARAHAFAYPSTLNDWLKPEWRAHDLRKTPVAPWLEQKHLARIRNFERVLNARYPTRSDLKLGRVRRGVLRAIGAWRYAVGFYGFPYEIAAMQRLFRYRQPEIEGF